MRDTVNYCHYRWRRKHKELTNLISANNSTLACLIGKNKTEADPISLDESNELVLAGNLPRDKEKLLLKLREVMAGHRLL